MRCFLLKYLFWLIFQERDCAQTRINELSEDIARLEYEKRSSFNESATLEEELSRTRAQLNIGEECDTIVSLYKHE